MQRAGHVILDGVVDPESWISHTVISDVILTKVSPHLWD